MIEQVFNVSDKIKNGRTIHDVFPYLIEEVGELATEINIKTGFSNKKPGKDGIIGESIDAIICLLDIIRLEQPDITEDHLVEIFERKLKKWQDKA